MRRGVGISTNVFISSWSESDALDMLQETQLTDMGRLARPKSHMLYHGCIFSSVFPPEREGQGRSVFFFSIILLLSHLFLFSPFISVYPILISSYFLSSFPSEFYSLVFILQSLPPPPSIHVLSLTPSQHKTRTLPHD